MHVWALGCRVRNPGGFGAAGAGGGRRNKKREILGPHPSEPHPSGPHPSGAPPFRGPTQCFFSPVSLFILSRMQFVFVPTAVCLFCPVLFFCPVAFFFFFPQHRITILGAPVGLPEFVSMHSAERQGELLRKVPDVKDLQCAWFILLCCGVTRATFYVRSVRPDLKENFAEQDYEQVWRCFCELVGASTQRQSIHEFASCSRRSGFEECFEECFEVAPCCPSGQLG